MMIFAVRPRIESRLKAIAEESLPKIDGATDLKVTFKGRDGVVSGLFATEEERGRVQSLTASLRVEGARKLETDFRLRELKRDPAVFAFSVRGREILAEGTVATADVKGALLGALKSVANGRAIIDEIRVSDRTLDAGWIPSAGDLLPVLVAGSEGPSLRIEGGTASVTGEALNEQCRKAIDEGLAGLAKTGLGIENTMSVAAPPEEPSLHLRAEEDAVVLEGLLPQGDAREIVVNGAQRGSAAGKIEDRIKIGEKVIAPKWIEGLGDLLAALLTETENAELEVSGTSLRLAGRVSDGPSKARLEATAGSIAGASGLELVSALTAPAPKEPASVALAFSAEALKITGVVPSEEVRQQIRTAVRRGSGNVAMEENVGLDENTAAPSWIEALDVFVPHLLINARSGDFRIEHELVYVSARVASNDHIAALDGALGAFTASSGLEVSEKQFLLLDPPAVVEGDPEPGNEAVETDPPATGDPEVVVGGEAAPMAGRPGNLAPPAFLPDFAIYFGHGTAMLKAEDEAQIKEMAATIKANPDVNLIVAGFSDSSGNRDFNEYLSGSRAEGVRDLLVRNGVKKARLEIRTFAAVGPKGADKEDPRLREFRRVEILVERSSGMGVGSLSVPDPSTDISDLEPEEEIGQGDSSDDDALLEMAAAASEASASEIPEGESPHSAGVDLSEGLVPDVEEGISDEVMDSLFATAENKLEPTESVSTELSADPEPAMDDLGAIGAAEGEPVPEVPAGPDGQAVGESSVPGEAGAEIPTVTTESPANPEPEAVAVATTVPVEEPAQPAPEAEATLPEVSTDTPPPATEEAVIEEEAAEPASEGEVAGTIYFGHGTALLTSGDRKELQKLAALLKEKGDRHFLATGFADPTGDPVFNHDLSEWRATNVRKVLAEAGLPASRITIEIIGASAVPGTAALDDEEAQRVNRRVEVRVLP